MGLSLGERCGLVMQSDIRAMSIECARMGGINLSQGVCDTPVPPVVLQGAADAVMQGANIYTHHTGIRELREAIVAKQRRFTGVAFDAEREVVVSAGATGAMYCAFQALLNRGDEVIVFEPFYGYHVSTLRAVEAVPLFVPLDPSDGWSFRVEALEAAVTPKTKALLINTPANPSGKVFSCDELALLAEFAIRHDLFVFTDEMYEHFVFGGLSHVSMASMPGMRERTITISGLSKTFSVTGWRIGYALCDPRWAASIGYFNDLFYVCAASPLQVGVTAGLRLLGDDYYHGLAAEYEVRRDLFCAALAEAGLEPHVPQGAYYVLAGTERLPGATAREKAMHILRETGVASVPGSAFYHDGGGENLVRFCFAKESHVLEAACEKLLKLR
ncbi:MAG TPA: pyridoxal phosphate-dependent aminotransferase [Chlorobaculum sp.]|uniref:Aminotransferase n=1 Tax=Chlorobaculum tepidum (strain ATCC 49652 / DSM 12025 / NBRC 103806 / TLS) TaxID=194439 RepID=Q8KCN2_CHLTE|nr:pyridoxal phosphate-dependent aminotransferase [Chlorobaculum tepidum]AAM72610.1 aspartate aminotransferase [Chlorobaculum tepidum TLS]HBU24532.1 pyridoxal phosphate-dependent aminotransferase [Chlorobaculum sp.]